MPFAGRFAVVGSGMALLNWSMSLQGYPAQSLATRPAIGMSHISTYQLLRLFQGVGVRSGWLLDTSASDQVAGLDAGQVNWVDLDELFLGERVALTEGLVSGSLVFVAAASSDGTPPGDSADSLLSWAEDKQIPWARSIDNEYAYAGDLNETLITAIVTNFLSDRPLHIDWQRVTVSPTARHNLVQGLFEHGWTRNLSLVHDADGRRPTLDLWGGVFADCLLQGEGRPGLATVDLGVRLQLRGQQWEIDQVIETPCPLREESGQVRPVAD